MLKQSRAFTVQAVLVTAVMTTAASAQSLPPTAPAAIDKVFADYDKADSPGCALAVYGSGVVARAVVRAGRVTNLTFERRQGPVNKGRVHCSSLDRP